jgi:trehalose 6-phosphate synthase/phosphatase
MADKPTVRRSPQTARAGRSGRARPGRIILVSNRLPVSVRVERGELRVERSAGGLATGLSPYHERGDGVWIGWPGETWRLTPPQLASMRKQLAVMRAVPMELTAAEVQRYYDGFSNGVLWPLLHYNLNRLPMNAEGWTTYRRVNQRFADAVVAEYRPGDLIWIHDYHLALVPAMVRRRLPDAAIGFFLHVPFPSAEVFRLLPWRRELLEGILGASVVGFHTVSYVLHFQTSAANVLGCETRQGRVRFEGRSIRVGTFPMGIDAAAFEELAGRADTVEEARRLRESFGGAALIVSVDRLDYTKGIPRRLLAFERLLERYPRLRGRVSLLQVAAPSRVDVSEYQQFRRGVDEIVGRINGRFALLGHNPIHYISQTLPPERLAAIYRAGDVALVTPLRDGMNLVAKEFVAARPDGDGVLVLSEFAGAAAELTDALLVNPYDLDTVAATIKRALEMPEAERRDRMCRLRERVKTQNIDRWARDFVAALVSEGRRFQQGVEVEQPSDVADAVLFDAERSGTERPLALLLDYDGTLVGLRPSPAEASPDAEILKILANLAILPGVSVNVVSGRRRDDLELWLGALPIGLHAEHGLWSRPAGEGRWHRREVDADWLATARTLMARRTAEVPGALVEEKDASIAWHYRNAEDELGRRAAAAMIRELDEALDGTGAAILQGHMVVEAKDAAISKGNVVTELRAELPAAKLVVVGDDQTDEDMFQVAPPDAVTVKVGSGPTGARLRLAGPDQVRRFLVELQQRLAARNQPNPESEADPRAGPLVTASAADRVR